MSKDKDYLDKFDEHRQEVTLDEVNRRRTRTRASRKKNKAPKSPLMTILVVIFIFIPLGLLAYVWLLYEPEIAQSEPSVKENVVEIEKNNPSSSVGATDEPDEEDKNDEASNEGSSNSGGSASNATDDVEVNDEEAEKIAKAAAEAEKKLKAEQEAEKKKKEEQEKANQNENKPKTHTVAESDTLYSIAMKYYKDPSMVEKIKQANKLTSDSIQLGSKLILP